MNREPPWPPDAVEPHIREGRRLIRSQLAVLRQLREDGLPAHHAQALLSALRETVARLRQRNCGDGR